MKTVKLISGILFLSLFAGCSRDEEVKTTDREELQFSTHIFHATVTEENKTRVNVAFPASQQLKLIVRDNSGEGFFSQKERMATTGDASGGESNKLDLSPDLLYWDDLGGKKANIKIIGIYPPSVTVDGEDNVAWNVTDDQRTGFESYDLKFAKKESYTYSESKTSEGLKNPALLEFKHVLTKVTLTLMAGGDFSLTDLGSAQVLFNAYKDAKCNILTMDPTAKTASTIQPYKAEIKEGETLKGYSYTILTFPFEVSGGLATIKINDNTYTVTPTKSKILAAGVHTTYNVTINKSDVVVNATITDWEKQFEPGSSSTLVEFGEFDITGGDVTITEGTTAKIAITDSGTGNPKMVEYKYNSSDEWEPVTKIYWDDITLPITKIEGLLTLGGEILTGDSYFWGVKTDKIEAITPVINLGTDFFKHPLSKISITIKTSTTVEGEKVNLKGIQSVIIPKCGTFKVADSGNSKGVSIVKNGSADQSITATGGYNEEGSEPVYICAPGFILPQTLTELCHVTVKEHDTDTYTNVYKAQLKANQQDFAAGTHYFFTVTITKSETVFDGTIKDWIIETEDDDIPTELGD